MATIDYPLIEQLGLTLLHFLWQGALLGILYWLALVIGRPASARTRYNLAVGTLLALGLMPVLTFAYLSSASAGAATLAGATAGSTWSSEGLAVMQLVVSATGQDQAITLLTWTVAGWLAGVLLLSARLVLGWHYITRLKRSARRDALAHLKPSLDRLRAAMGIRKSVALAVSDRIPSPVVVGWLKPLILFPPALVARLSANQVEMILAHELAHIRRNDHLINLIQIVIETLLFYHPVVALVSRQIRIERENACDDLALASTQDRLAYVEMLASLERFRQPGPSLTLGLQDGQILGRIRRLVERSRPRRQIGVTLPALLGLMLLAGSTGLWLMPDPDREAIASAPAGNPTDMPRPTLEEVATGQAPSTAPLFSLPRAGELAAAPAAAVDPPEDARSALPAGAESRPSVSLDLDRATASLEPLPPVQSAAPSTPIDESVDTPTSRPADDRAGPQSVDTTASLNRAAGRPESDLRQLAMATPAPASIEDSIPSSAPRPSIPELTGGDLLRQVEPSFPRKARSRGVNGIVELEFTVDERGRVRGVGVIDEQPGGYDFGAAATAAIEQWRFEPYRRGEDIVERQVRLEVEFDLAEICSVSTGSRLPRC
jgi:TonB family protein